ncbi:MAG: hypothetical protein ABFD82_18360 [Syntrophaceae bacterium]
MKDELKEILNDSTLLEVEVEYLADKLETLLAPIIEKAEKYDALCLIKDPIQVEREYFQELVEKARKWDRVKKIAVFNCDDNPNSCPLETDVCHMFCLAERVVDALEGGQDDKP